MNSQQPLVSILLPIHNAGDFLNSALDSLFKQTYQDIEIIAIDDKSSDSSFNILKSAKKKYKHLKITRNKKHYGLATCLNRGIKKAKGEFIAFMDPKGVASLHRVKKQVQYLLENPKTVAVGSQCTYIDEKGKRLEQSSFPLNHNVIHPRLLSNLPMQFESVMINKLLLPKDILKFNKKEYPIVYRDVFAKMIQFGEFANIDTVYYWHRIILNASSKRLSSSISHAQLFLKSIIMYEYRPSLRSLFQPLLNA
jgi:glycosyltransferase involved in cell wall biosynthesis